MTAKTMIRLSNILFALAILAAIVMGALYLMDITESNGAYPVGMGLGIVAFVVNVLAESRASDGDQR